MKAQGAPCHQPRWLGCGLVFGVGAGFQKGIALGFVQHQVERQHRHMVAHAGLQLQQGGPQRRVVVAVKHAFEQRNHQGGEVVAGLGGIGGDCFRGIF